MLLFRSDSRSRGRRPADGRPRSPSGTSWANRAKKLNCFVKITSNEGRGRKEGIDNLTAALFLNRARWNLDSPQLFVRSLR